MKRAIKKLRTCLLLALLVSIIVPAASGYAITARQKALNAYKKLLSRYIVDIYGYGRGYSDYNGTGDVLIGSIARPRHLKYSLPLPI